MKKVLGLFLTAALFAGVFTACGPTETTTPELKLELKADKDVVVFDGIDKVVFTVELDGVDITGQEGVQICDPTGVCLLSNEFIPGEIKEYLFHATYEQNKEIISESEYVSITSTGAIFDASKDIKKNVAFFQWTATWCGPCTNQKANMKQLLATNGDNIVQVQLHTSNDDIESPSSLHESLSRVNNEIRQDGRFPKLQYIPTSVIEFLSGIEGTASYAQLNNAYTTYSANPAKTGLMVNSKIADKINVTVTVGAKNAGDYSLGIFLVEDHVTAPQAGVGNSYDHTNVARQQGSQSLFGDSIGSMETGQTIEKKFSFEILDKYKTNDLALVVYITYTNANGKPVIDNAVKVTADGFTDYNYAE